MIFLILVQALQKKESIALALHILDMSQSEYNSKNIIELKKLKHMNCLINNNALNILIYCKNVGESF